MLFHSFTEVSENFGERRLTKENRKSLDFGLKRAEPHKAHLKSTITSQVPLGQGPPAYLGSKGEFPRISPTSLQAPSPTPLVEIDL